jgi:hypothetical protein
VVKPITLGAEQLLFDCVLAHEQLEDMALMQNFRLRGAEPVSCDAPALRLQGYEVMLAPLCRAPAPAPPSAMIPAAWRWR